MQIQKILIALLLFIGQTMAWSATTHEKVAILGSGPAGLTAAIYAARADLSPVVIEGREPGGQLVNSYLVENYPGFPNGVEGSELMALFRQQAEKFGTRFVASKVRKVDLSSRPFRLIFKDGNQITCEALIIATGASVKWLGLESETALKGHGVTACATCDGPLFYGKEVVVVGGGCTALDEAIALSKYASKVTVINRSSHLRAAKFLQNKALANPKIHFIFDTVVDEILDPSQKVVTGIKIRNVITQDTHRYPCQGVFIAIGHQPNTSLFQGQLDMDADGYLITQPNSTQTSIPGVFAAGDIADRVYRQGITAAARGCMAALDADHFLFTEE